MSNPLETLLFFKILFVSSYVLVPEKKVKKVVFFFYDVFVRHDIETGSNQLTAHAKWRLQDLIYLKHFMQLLQQKTHIPKILH